MTSQPSYKITVAPKRGYWVVRLYALKLTPIFENDHPVPVRQQEDWVRMSFPYEDTCLTYWGARFTAWKLKLRLDRGSLSPFEETIYEKKGHKLGKS